MLEVRSRLGDMTYYVMPLAGSSTEATDIRHDMTRTNSERRRMLASGSHCQLAQRSHILRAQLLSGTIEWLRWFAWYLFLPLFQININAV